jgi:hypothetical protein
MAATTPAPARSIKVSPSTAPESMAARSVFNISSGEITGMGAVIWRLPFGQFAHWTGNHA